MMYDNDALSRLAKGAKSAGSDAIGSTSASDPACESPLFAYTRQWPASDVFVVDVFSWHLHKVVASQLLHIARTFEDWDICSYLSRRVISREAMRRT